MRLISKNNFLQTSERDCHHFSHMMGKQKLGTCCDNWKNVWKERQRTTMREDSWVFWCGLEIWQHINSCKLLEITSCRSEWLPMSVNKVFDDDEFTFSICKQHTQTDIKASIKQGMYTHFVYIIINVAVRHKMLQTQPPTPPMVVKEVQEDMCCQATNCQLLLAV